MGDDHLYGGLGADILDGGAGNDTANYFFATADVSVDLGLNLGTQGEASGDTYFSIENIAGADAGNDTLIGNGAGNTIWGNAGDDTILGKGGNDFLIGGAGDDLFVFENIASNDTVADFSAGAGSPDVLDLGDFNLLSSYADFNDFMANAASEAAGNTTLTLDADNSVTLIGVSIADLHQDDLLFF
mgnify:CR=1 FL=1